MVGVKELGQFLRARRAAGSSWQVGLPDDAPRRTSGLKQEEVARLAALSEGVRTARDCVNSSVQ